MGRLVNGTWHTHDTYTAQGTGAFVRSVTSFHDQVSNNASAAFPAVSGRYHLYVAMACPWAHRTLIVRSLKGLEAAISVSTVDPDMLDQGWSFTPQLPDHQHGFAHLHQLYAHAAPTYSGRVTVPVLYDTLTQRIVNNESAEIIRMFNGPMAHLGTPADEHDLYPETLHGEIDAINERIYHGLNNGVYRCGFATTQQAYDRAVAQLFDTLDWLEEHLKDRQWLVGNQPTEADWRLFPTLYRFDPVYHHHFKCSMRRLRDYPRLWDYTRRLYNHPGIAKTCDLQATRRHYFFSHTSINPHRIIPVAPAMDYSL